MTDPTPAPLPTPEPHVADDARPYWEAARAHVLALPRCTDCETTFWYPRGVCPACGSFDLDWFEAPGTGIVYARAIASKGQGDYRDAAPYVVAYVELDLPGAPAGDPAAPNPRVLTNVVGCDPADVAIGLRVEATFDDTPAGEAVLRFRPIAAG